MVIDPIGIIDETKCLEQNNINFDDIEMKKNYDGSLAYFQSKLHNVLLVTYYQVN